MRILENIDYKKVFYYFEEISNIPRGSGFNTAISNYLVDFAKEHNFDYYQDEFENVIIYKKASEGAQNKDAVIIQAHMDMVCEKLEEVEHDFTTQGLELIVENGFVRANGTTLGGDDGIGVAYALAFLDDDSYIHPDIEVLITTDEETGMDGAIGLDSSHLKGKYMLNIDSEEEGILLSSCAGGLTAVCKTPVAKVMKSGVELNLKISGLKGGHSGTEIDKNGQNAILLLVRILNKLRCETDFDIISIKGGNKDNVIPAEAEAKLLVNEEVCEKLAASVAYYTELLKREMLCAEENMHVDLTISNGMTITNCEVLDDNSKNNILTILHLVPNAVQTMSGAVEGLVESSLNLGIIKTLDNEIVTHHSIRSSVNDYKLFVLDKITTLYGLFGGSVSRKSEYPAWEYKKDSYLRDICSKVYEEQYGKKISIQAIHAGLECGILSSKNGDLDIVSFGPDIFDIHTPRERMNIESVKRVYDFMVEVIKHLA